MEKKDGGPAFPMKVALMDAEEPVDVFSFAPGITLRDYFASAALTGLASNYDNFRYLASDSYKIADAMLYEREANHEDN